MLMTIYALYHTLVGQLKTAYSARSLLLSNIGIVTVTHRPNASSSQIMFLFDVPPLPQTRTESKLHTHCEKIRHSKLIAIDETMTAVQRQLRVMDTSQCLGLMVGTGD